MACPLRIAVIAAALLAGVHAPGQTTSVVKVMPLGDSITEAHTPRASYRYFLWHALRDSGHCVDFVGSRRGVSNGPPKYPDFDQDHEGHWGWRVDEILRSLPRWAAANPPDVALVHLGTNDIWQRQTVASTVGELGRVVDELRRANPRVTVLLARLIPGRPYDVQPLNAALPALPTSKSPTASPVVLVDQFTGFDWRTSTYDGVHPNEKGEQQMAGVWQRAILALDRRCTAAYRTFGSGCRGTAGTPSLAPATAGDRPIVGKSFVVVLGGLPVGPAHRAFGVLGASDRTWNGSPLPLALDAIGMPGCAMLVGADVLVGLTNTSGSARWVLAIPNRPVLAGGDLFQQGFVLDTRANALGAVVSNGGAGRVGMR